MASVSANNSDAPQAQGPSFLRWAAVLSPALALPLLGSLIALAFFAQWRGPHEPIHAVVEAAGALVAFFIVLVVQESRDGFNQTPSESFFISSALISMGILDLVHSAVHVGPAFVWFHSTATFAGGVLFAGVCLPQSWTNRLAGNGKWVVLATMLFAAFYLSFPQRIPLMVTPEKLFTPLAKALNILGGVGFMIAAWHFARTARGPRQKGNELLTAHCVLFGVAGMLFEASSLWDAAWWWWHVLRLVAYLVLIEFFFKAFHNYREYLAEANQELESRVEIRTAELKQKNQSITAVFDAIEQGLVTIDSDGKLSGEASVTFQEWFNSRQGDSFSTVLGQWDLAVSQHFDVAWDFVKDGILSPEVSFEQLPQQVQHGGRTIALEYRAMEIAEPQRPVRTLVVATDITARIERDRSEAHRREALAVFHHTVQDRAGFVDFLEESDKLVTLLQNDRLTRDQAELFRSIHTLKGSCSLYGLETMVEHCHELESQLIEEARAPTAEEKQQTIRLWQETKERIIPFVDGMDSRVDLSHHELEQALSLAHHLQVPSALTEQLQSWRFEQVCGRLERLGQQAQRLAMCLGKGAIKVDIEGSAHRLPREPFGAFWTNLAHVVRNAVDHGFEAPAERQKLGKAPVATLHLQVEQTFSEVRISISDDGAGIDWQKLGQKAQSAGLPYQTPQDLQAALFMDGISSKDSVTTTSGRGVGMSAVRSCCQDLCGEIEVQSIPGEGTTFAFVFPLVVLFEPSGPNPSPNSPSGEVTP